MKNSKIIIPAILFVMSIVLLSCSKSDDAPGYGDMTLRLTDAPGDFLQVNVDLQQVRFRYSENDSDSLSGWIDIPTIQGVYNLLDLQNGLSVIIADTNAISTGKISQIRLILGSNNSVMLPDSSIHPLEIPSSSSSGLKVQVNADIKAGMLTDITIDFDAGLSVVKDDSIYKLRPVVKLHKVNYHSR